MLLQSAHVQVKSKNNFILKNNKYFSRWLLLIPKLNTLKLYLKYIEINSNIHIAQLLKRPAKPHLGAKHLILS